MEVKMKTWFMSLWSNIKFYVVLIGILACVFFGLSKITLSQQQQSTQHMSTSQIVNNQNINVVYAGQTWLITNESYTSYNQDDVLPPVDFINSLNYYQQTRMHVIHRGNSWWVIYPITPANTTKVITNFVSNQNFNTNSVQMKSPFNFDKYLPWKKK
jgi:hypothetical protein